jgi:hypothetical protein
MSRQLMPVSHFSPKTKAPHCDLLIIDTSLIQASQGRQKFHGFSGKSPLV